MAGLQKHIQEVLQINDLHKSDSLLLACSGGKDSMVLLHILLALGYRPAVAHANFQLRGKDSEGDETFVRDFCAEKKLPFFSMGFDTRAETETSGESIQMAARRLRYTWLFELKEEQGFKRVLTAHHERDQAETLLLNLMRGTGPLGLQGMVVDDGRLFRPMLRMEYPSITAYAEEHKVAYREDISNKVSKYKRNFIRHLLLTPWEERYPGTIRQISKSSEMMEEANRFFQAQLDKELQPFIHKRMDTLQIDYRLTEHPSAHLLMRHLLKDVGMADQAEFVLQERSRPGAIFSSKTHELLADREHWILRVKTMDHGPWTIGDGEMVRLGGGETGPQGEMTSHGKIESVSFGAYNFILRPAGPGESIPKDNNVIFLSDELLQNGLYFRSWQEGDKMKPFGMKGNKKLSDLFIDAGIDRFSKQSMPVLCDSDGNILWVAGIRSSELLRLSSPKAADWVLEFTV